MNCEYFGECGSCNLGHLSYEDQLDLKISKERDRFTEYYSSKIDIIKSDDGAFRNRVEFRTWKIYNDDSSFKLSYAMNDVNKTILTINSCSIVSHTIANLMPLLIEEISKLDILHMKFFTVEFLTSTTGDILVTLIYHKKLDDTWNKEAKKLEEKLNIKIIGRSRKQKVIISEDFINESLLINNHHYKFNYKEGGFTQPNQKVNIQMIEWVTNNMQKSGDLCELYCGGGNFTIPLSKYFTKVIATEISKTSIKSAELNCKLNDISNINFVRMSSEEFVQARNNVREFRRMKDIQLNEYNFSTIFIDPPRAGLDETTRALCKQFDQIIYISCNPETLKRDLEELCVSHKVTKFALFDQFAYTTHIEAGTILLKI
jgi:tRNA (uracil-5-)-methyltransferase